MSKSMHQTTTSEQGNSVAQDFICANCMVETHPTDHEAIACCVDINQN